MGSPALALGFATAVLSFSMPSGAAENGRPDTPDRSIEFSAGPLVLTGGNHWTRPGGDTGAYGGLGFASSAGGFAWGAEGYGEARFLRYLGLALTLGYDLSVIRRKSRGGTVALEENLSIQSARLGLMAKGILHVPWGRLWSGLGSQFVLTPSAEADNTISGRPLAVNVVG